MCSVKNYRAWAVHAFCCVQPGSGNVLFYLEHGWMDQLDNGQPKKKQYIYIRKMCNMSRGIYLMQETRRNWCYPFVMPAKRWNCPPTMGRLQKDDVRFIDDSFTGFCRGFLLFVLGWVLSFAASTAIWFVSLLLTIMGRSNELKIKTTTQKGYIKFSKTNYILCGGPNNLGNPLAMRKKGKIVREKNEVKKDLEKQKSFGMAIYSWAK